MHGIIIIQSLMNRNILFGNVYSPQPPSLVRSNVKKIHSSFARRCIGLNFNRTTCIRCAVVRVHGMHTHRTEHTQHLSIEIVVHVNETQAKNYE